MSIHACDMPVLYRRTVNALQHPEAGGIERQIVDRADRIIIRALGPVSWSVLEQLAQQVVGIERQYDVRVG